MVLNFRPDMNATLCTACLKSCSVCGITAELVRVVGNQQSTIVTRHYSVLLNLEKKLSKSTIYIILVVIDLFNFYKKNQTFC